MSIIQPNKTASKLHQHAEAWEKGKVRSFLVVTVYDTGNVYTDFEVEEINGPGELAALGAATANGYEHLRTLHKQRFS